MAVAHKAEFLLLITFILSEVLVIVPFQFLIFISLNWGKRFGVMLNVSLILGSHRKALMCFGVIPNLFTHMRIAESDCAC